MHLFGLTGGIASGKSTVATRLRELRVPVIDADELARAVVAPGTDGLRQLVEAFGAGILAPSGGLDRKTLARLVFSDDQARRRLNQITHPRIATRTNEIAVELARAGESLACYEAALIVENGLADAFRPLIVCSCPEGTQSARLQARDGLSAEDALARIRAQKPLQEKIRVADHVIDTNGSIESTREQTDRVLAAIRAALRVGPQ